MLYFLRTTIVGGLLFLAPVVAVALILGKVILLIRLVTRPLADSLGIEGWLLGISVDLVSFLILVLLCFLAGLAARATVARRFMAGIDKALTEHFPVYAHLTARAKNVMSAHAIENVRPVLVRFEGYYQLGFEVEPVAKDHVAVHLPGSPDVWAGSLSIVERARVVPLTLSVQATADLVRRLGVGSGECLASNLEADSEADSKVTSPRSTLRQP